jgi:hypothetical protein
MPFNRLFCGGSKRLRKIVCENNSRLKLFPG